jgi:uncharacterized membrane protein YkgB
MNARRIEEKCDMRTKTGAGEAHMESSGAPLASARARRQTGERLRAIGERLTETGLVVVLLWIGAMKFTAYEASSIEPLVAASPLLRWVYEVWSVQGFSNVLGAVEIAIGASIALRAVSPRAAVLGSASAVAMFVTTLSFLLSTPGWEPSLGGFPGLAVLPGQFLLKDVVLLGASVRLLGDSLAAVDS